MEQTRLNDVLQRAQQLASPAPRGLTEAILARLDESPGIRRVLIASAALGSLAAILVSGLVSREIAVHAVAKRPPVQQLFTPGGGLIDAS